MKRQTETPFGRMLAILAAKVIGFGVGLAIAALVAPLLLAPLGWWPW